MGKVQDLFHVYPGEEAPSGKSLVYGFVGYVFGEYAPASLFVESCHGGIFSSFLGWSLGVVGLHEASVDSSVLLYECVLLCSIVWIVMVFVMVILRTENLSCNFQQGSDGYAALCNKEDVSGLVRV